MDVPEGGKGGLFLDFPFFFVLLHFIAYLVTFAPLATSGDKHHAMKISFFIFYEFNRYLTAVQKWAKPLLRSLLHSAQSTSFYVEIALLAAQSVRRTFGLITLTLTLTQP